MHHPNDIQHISELVIDWISKLSDDERMILMNKYTRLTENIYCTYGTDENISIISKIFNLKLSSEALVKTYVKGDPIVDYPGHQLGDFLNKEMGLCDYPETQGGIQESLAA